MDYDENDEDNDSDEGPIQGMDRDTVFCIIKDPSLFVSKENGEHYDNKI